MFNTNPILRSRSPIFTICHSHKEQQQQFAVCSQKGTLFICAFSCQDPRWVTWHKLALRFSICQRGRLKTYPTETGFLPLSFIKNKRPIRDSHPLYYRAYAEHLSLSNPVFSKKEKRKTQHVCVGSINRTSPYGLKAALNSSTCVHDLRYCKICFSFSGSVTCLMQWLAIKSTSQ